jgi:hypothetical protein
MNKCFLLNGVLLCLCLGCGPSEYQTRMAQRKASSASEALGPAEELTGTRVSICAPRCMTLLPQGTDPKRSKTIPIPIPGAQQRIYEGFVKDSAGGEMPFYCCIIALEVPKVPGASPMSQMQATMGQVQFSEFQAASPEGKESKWQMARELNKDEFYYKGKDGKDTLQPMDAVAEGYFHEEAGFFVMVMWRLPTSIEKNIGGVGLAELAKQTVGAVSFKPQ